MALVVFLRAVNVGGRTLRARALADELDLVNVGAAGTFVAPRAADAKALERAIRRKLPFESEVFVCAGKEILRLVRSEPFGAAEPEKGVKRTISVLARPPRPRPKLPIERPQGPSWEVRVVQIVGRHALCERRRLGARLIYPNEVVEKGLGIAATTRGWDTLLAICRILEEVR
ncbi:MAG TPA: DUF1697 domain-containing protein [Anaeromyxobacteraceae bacterium]